MLNGRVIYSKKKAVFVQVDKNFQVCDLFEFNKKEAPTNRIGSRVYPDLLNTFRGRPLYTAWNGLIEAINQKVELEEDSNEQE